MNSWHWKWTIFKIRAKWFLILDWWQILCWLFPGWQRLIADKGIRLLEWIVKDSELILEVQSEQYQETANKFLAKPDKDNQMIGRIYQGISEGLHWMAFDCYASFK